MAEIDPSEVRRLVREAVDRALGPERAGPGPVPAPAIPSAAAARRVAIGSDHGGYELKEILKRYIADELGWTVHDCGSHSTAPVDYPDFILPAALAVANGDCERGVVLGGSGNGEAMAANRVRGVRCALCWSEESARLARAHNDANMISLGQRLLGQDEALRIVETWLSAPFEGGRHEARIRKLDLPG